MLQEISIEKEMTCNTAAQLQPKPLFPLDGNKNATATCSDSHDNVDHGHSRQFLFPPGVSEAPQKWIGFWNTENMRVFYIFDML